MELPLVVIDYHWLRTLCMSASTLPTSSLAKNGVYAKPISLYPLPPIRE